MLADAAATALFVAGYEEAIHLVQPLGVEAYLLSTQGDVFMSDGFRFVEV